MDEPATEVVRGLSGDLLKIASDPAKLGVLYETLGEFCHVFRNRLNSLKLSLYLARTDGPEGSDGRWAELDRRYRELEGLMERLQLICRPMRLTPMPVALAMLFDERRVPWMRSFEPRSIRLDLVAPPEPVVSVLDPIRMGQGLDALAAWRGETAAAHSSVQVEWRVDDGDVVVLWTEPAVTRLPLDDSADDRPASLALPMLARIVAAHGGRLDASIDNGFVLRLRWPLGACAA